MELNLKACENETQAPPLMESYNSQRTFGQPTEPAEGILKLERSEIPRLK